MAESESGFAGAVVSITAGAAVAVSGAARACDFVFVFDFEFEFEFEFVDVATGPDSALGANLDEANPLETPPLPPSRPRFLLGES